MSEILFDADSGQTALLLSQASTLLRCQRHRTGWQVFKTSSFGDKQQDDALTMTRSSYNLEILKRLVIYRGALLYLHIWHMTDLLAIEHHVSATFITKF